MWSLEIPLIRLTDELATEIEIAAADSLEQYVEWYNTPHTELLERKYATLEYLSHFDQFYPPEFKSLSGGRAPLKTADADILRMFVELAIIHTILNATPSYS